MSSENLTNQELADKLANRERQIVELRAKIAHLERVGASNDVSERQQSDAEMHLFLKNFNGIAYKVEALKFRPTLFAGMVEEITGYPAEDFLQSRKTWDQMIHPDDFESLMTEGKKLLEKPGYVGSLEYRIIRKDGAVRWVGDIIRAIGDGSTETTYFYGALIDITARKEAEAKLNALTGQLKEEKKALTAKNIALREVLDHIERDRSTYRSNLCAAVEDLFSPVVERLERGGGSLNPREIATLERNLQILTETDLDSSQPNLSRLSPRETQVCELIRSRNSSHEIAGQLHISVETVSKHRQIIRRKLQLQNKKINLATFLRNFQPK